MSRRSDDESDSKKVITGIAGMMGALGLAAGIGLLISHAVSDSSDAQQEQQDVPHRRPTQKLHSYSAGSPPPYSSTVSEDHSEWSSEEVEEQSQGKVSRLPKAGKKWPMSKEQPHVNNKPTSEVGAVHLTDCSHFLHQRCNYGDKCKFRHNDSITVDTPHCRRWPNCTLITCRFMHSKLPHDAPPMAKTSSSTTTRPILSSPTATTKEVQSISRLAPLSSERFVHYFWDVENCPLSRNSNAFDVVKAIRQLVAEKDGLKERSFRCYCDPTTLGKDHRLGLSHANIQVIDVPDKKPGAADRRLQLDLDRLERDSQLTIVLISGDIDFVGKLNDLRYQHGCTVILIHNQQANKNLKATAHRCYEWSSLIRPHNVGKTAQEGKQALEEMGRKDASNISESEVFKCPQCGFKATCTSSLDQHQQAKNHWWECPQASCARAFDSAQALAQHQEAKGHWWDCPRPSCVKAFDTAQGLKSHQSDTGHK